MMAGRVVAASMARPPDELVRIERGRLARRSVRVPPGVRDPRRTPLPVTSR
jgi:hypothetical protein